MRFSNGELQRYDFVSVPGVGSAPLDLDEPSARMEDMASYGSSDETSSEAFYQTRPVPHLELCSMPCCPAEEEMNAIAYTLHAQCNFNVHPALTLFLWSPAHLYIGAVGYYSEGTGEFVTLLNAYCATELPSGSRLPPIWTRDGQFKVVFFKYHHDNAHQLDVELIPGRPAASAFARSATYGYMDDFYAAKEWFQAFADVIVEEYGARHRIQKKDLALVTGILNAEDYTLFISHAHPPARLSFTVDPNRIRGRPWGKFEIRTVGAPPPVEDAYFQENTRCHCSQELRIAGKTSMVRFENEKEADPLGGDTLMLARLGFRDGEEEPVLL